MIILFSLKTRISFKRPKSWNCLADAEALVSYGLPKLHGIYLIEELFHRDIDDDQEDEEMERP